MCSLDTLKVDLKGLNGADKTIKFTADDHFFGAIGGSEVRRGAVDVELHIHPATDRLFDLELRIAGTVIVACDRCLEDLSQPVSAESHAVVRLGVGNSDGVDDDVIAVDENEAVLDAAWLVYEQTVLAIPIKHVHEPGMCDRAMTELLSEHSGAARSSDEEAIDPRWSKLKELKINN